MLVPAGLSSEALLTELARRCGCAVGPGRIDLSVAFDARRRQYNATRLLLALKENYEVPVVALTEYDLFIPVLTFVFGEAELGGRAAVVSVHRLREEFYGMPPDQGLLFQRAIRELRHEIGHLRGLVHCRDAACVMSASHSVDQVDTKTGDLCRQCAAFLDHRRPGR